MKTVGERIRKYRKEKGLTQKQLGELCNPQINEANIRKYELGKQKPKIETLERIANALEIPLFALMSFDTMQEDYPEESWNNTEKSRFLYLKNLGYEIIEPNYDTDNFFIIYYDGYRYTIPYEEPSDHFDVLCEVIDSYAKFTIEDLIKKYAIKKEKL